MEIQATVINRINLKTHVMLQLFVRYGDLNNNKIISKKIRVIFVQVNLFMEIKFKGHPRIQSTKSRVKLEKGRV